jgi:hypothetical protein
VDLQAFSAQWNQDELLANVPTSGNNALSLRQIKKLALVQIGKVVAMRRFLCCFAQQGPIPKASHISTTSSSL